MAADLSSPVLPLAPAPAPAARVAGPGRPSWDALALFGRSVLHSYAQVLFAKSLPLGAVLLLATLVVPSVGLVGLGGVVLASAVAMLLRLDRRALADGVLGYNALLSFLALGAMFDRGPMFWGAAGVLAFAVVLGQVALDGALRFHLRLSALSLPFVVTTWLVMAASPHVRGLTWTQHLPVADLPALPVPAWFDTFLRTLGAIFFQPHALSGLLVFVALVAWSRVAAVHALVGFAVSAAAERWLFTFPPETVQLTMGFNLLLTAVAVGGIFYVPSVGSLALAAMASLLTGLVGVGLHAVLQPVGLPVLAAPFNLTVLLVIYALRQREAGAEPHAIEVLGASPEDNLHHHRTRVARFSTRLAVPLRLPFRGTWVVTQGHDGAHTHQGPWRHGLDFEVADGDGRRCEGDGSALSQWRCYGLPVLAMAPGRVVKVVDGVPDNVVGAQDTRQPWGNVVVIEHGPELFSALAHLQPGSVTVREGDAVVAGQVVARVGSSGRSPVPHLHVQLQRTAAVGDPTVPIAFHGVVHATPQGDHVCAERVPAEGDRVRNPSRGGGLARGLWLPVGTRLRVEVRVDGGPAAVETLVSEVDLLGARSLVSVERGSRLWVDDLGDAFVAYDHAGPRDGALFALYAALARVPDDDARALTWTDFLNPRRLSGAPLAWLADAVAAFMPVGEQPVAYTARADADGVTVHGVAAARRPWQVDVRTVARFGPDGTLRAVQCAAGGRVIDVAVEAST